MQNMRSSQKTKSVDFKTMKSNVKAVKSVVKSLSLVTLENAKTKIPVLKKILAHTGKTAALGKTASKDLQSLLNAIVSWKDPKVCTSKRVKLLEQLKKKQTKLEAKLVKVEVPKIKKVKKGGNNSALYELNGQSGGKKVQKNSKKTKKVRKAKKGGDLLSKFFGGFSSNVVNEEQAVQDLVM